MAPKATAADTSIPRVSRIGSKCVPKMEGMPAAIVSDEASSKKSVGPARPSAPDGWLPTVRRLRWRNALTRLRRRATSRTPATEDRRPRHQVHWPDPLVLSEATAETSMGMHTRRFTRLTNAFSKKVENHAHAVALFAMYYNFVRIHKTLRTTPAMTAKVTDRLREIGDIVDALEAWEASQ